MDSLNKKAAAARNNSKQFDIIENSKATQQFIYMYVEHGSQSNNIAIHN